MGEAELLENSTQVRHLDLTLGSQFEIPEPGQMQPTKKDPMRPYLLLPFLLLACGDADPNPPVTTDGGSAPTPSAASVPDAAPSRLCEKDSYSFCRCKNGTEGVKKCAADEASYGPCSQSKEISCE